MVMSRASAVVELVRGGFTTFPLFSLLRAYYGLFPEPQLRSSFRQPRHSPSIVTLLFIITYRRGSPFILISDSDSLCLPSYLPISDILYDT